MRLPAGLGALALAACGPATSSAPEPARCGPNVPEMAQHPIAMRAILLAGDYELIQVQTQPKGGSVISGRLHLAPLDSTARAGAVGGAARDLVGWFDPAQGDRHWRAIVGSRDPAHPGVVLAGQHLMLGEIGALDGHIEHLTITAVAPMGFWGWWKVEPGFEITTDADTRRILPDPAGYFCALRTPSDGTR